MEVQKTTNTITTEEELPELLNVKETAHLLGVSVSTLNSMNYGGNMPQPLHLGKRRGCVRFSRRELKAWIAAKCPPRVKWETVKEQYL